MTDSEDRLEKVERAAERLQKEAEKRGGWLADIDAVWDEILERNGFRSMLRGLGKGGG